MPRSPRTPSYRLHKASGQAVVTLSGVDHYLGIHGTPASHAEYRRLVAEWLANGCRAAPQAQAPAPPDLTVDEVLDRYWRHAEDYYRQQDHDSGDLVPTQQTYRVRQALAPVRDLYGHTPASRFGPLALQAVRAAYVRAGLARKSVNQLVGCVKRAWKWAAANELVPGPCYQALLAVEGLKLGRTEAPETDPVLPVPEHLIPPVRERVLPVVRDLVDLQLLTAARPGELLRLRPADVDRKGDVWVYRPRQHKTAYRGHARTVFLGPRAQDLLGRYLPRAADAYCFSPREAVAQLQAAQGRAARTNAGDRYDVSSYVRAIRRACDQAGVDRWRPHQLRHNAATRLVEQFGWDVARMILGHRTLCATRVYAEDAVRKAVEVMRKVG